MDHESQSNMDPLQSRGGTIDCSWNIWDLCGIQSDRNNHHQAACDKGELGTNVRMILASKEFHSSFYIMGFWGIMDVSIFFMTSA